MRLIEGALAADALARLEAHVDGCERCAAVLGEFGARGARGGNRTVDRYQLDRRIAAGGMGEVWAAWDPKLRRDVAVKLVRPDRADESRERDRLLREARALARLTHPNVIAVYDVGEHDGEVFIVTDLVVGDTLANRGGAAADWPTVVSLYAQAARGLAAAHAGGLVHRDVKPANLLVGADGRVRVADFGLAIKTAPSPSVGGAPASVSDVWRVTRPGAIAGTPAYMAPEQRLGQAVEAPADQFALCTALGEAIAGRRPTADITPAALHAFVCERRTDAPGLASLCEVIARGLAFEATGRHANMTALADSLEAIGDGRRPATRPADVALAATGTALAATSAALGDTRDSTPPARTDGPRARTPSTGPEAIGDTLLPARPGSSGDGCRAPSDRGGVRRDAPSTDRGGSQRADSGRADSGRADSGRADSGRADSGHADSSRADSGRADSGRGARTPETTRPPLTSSDEAAREHAGAGARGRGTAVTAPPPLDPRAASDDDGPAGERRGLLRGAAIVIGAAALGGLGVWWMLRAREVAPPPSAAAQDSVAAASATTTPAIAPTAAPAPAAMTASDPTAAALSAPGAATAPGTATAAIRTRTGTPPGAATSAIRTGTGSRPTPPSPATRAAPAQVTGLPTPATAAPATAAPATAAPSPTAPFSTAPSSTAPSSTAPSSTAPSPPAAPRSMTFARRS